mmetsp:Transcript_17603/g.48303  ORF Transcript_17603/g.48303 Transcript_17603/m.48303 type:complete len:239 (+) Transcript_17603:1303-2019(+)
MVAIEDAPLQNDLTSEGAAEAQIGLRPGLPRAAGDLASVHARPAKVQSVVAPVIEEEHAAPWNDDTLAGVPLQHALDRPLLQVIGLAHNEGRMSGFLPRPAETPVIPCKRLRVFFDEFGEDRRRKRLNYPRPIDRRRARRWPLRNDRNVASSALSLGDPDRGGLGQREHPSAECRVESVVHRRSIRATAISCSLLGSECAVDVEPAKAGGARDDALRIGIISAWVGLPALHLAWRALP